MRQFWYDESGAILSSELAVLGSVLVIGLVAGLASLRDAVVSELSDVGAAIARIDQSYTIVGITSNSAAVAGSAHRD